jgi:hypothetical protein
VRYWWATQSTNYPEAIARGTIWTCPRAEGKPLKESRRLIKDMRLGDVVFHHHDGRLKAVSTVVEEWHDHPRPKEYPRGVGEGDEGWLVRAEPIATGLNLPFTRVSQLITKGHKGPLNLNGEPARKYLSPLSEEDALSLITELRVDLPCTDDGLLGRPADFWGGDDTDVLSLRTIRAEQSELRRHLLRGRLTAECSICGKVLPTSLLIAGHIKPRSKCSEDERRDYRAAAMLVCNLGCDALFEWGYVVVDGGGKVRPGRSPETEGVRGAVAAVSGKSCLAFSTATSGNFAEHAKLVFGP